MVRGVGDYFGDGSFAFSIFGSFAFGDGGVHLA
jgi:hypothetical protein